jgi:hypothetical protein
MALARRRSNRDEHCSVRSKIEFRSHVGGRSPQLLRKWGSGRPHATDFVRSDHVAERGEALRVGIAQNYVRLGAGATPTPYLTFLGALPRLHRVDPHPQSALLIGLGAGEHVSRRPQPPPPHGEAAAH